MDIERHESFTITLTGTEAWNFCAEVEELNSIRDSGDVGNVLTGNLVTIRELADTFAARQYLMPSEPPRFLSGRPIDDSRPNVPEEFRPKGTRKWTD